MRRLYLYDSRWSYQTCLVISRSVVGILFNMSVLCITKIDLKIKLNLYEINVRIAQADCRKFDKLNFPPQISDNLCREIDWSDQWSSLVAAGQYLVTQLAGCRGDIFQTTHLSWLQAVNGQCLCFLHRLHGHSHFLSLNSASICNEEGISIIAEVSRALLTEPSGTLPGQSWLSLTSWHSVWMSDGNDLIDHECHGSDRMRKYGRNFI